MATEVGKREEIKLVDGTEVMLKPLPIKTLRKFMKKLDELDEIVKQDGFDQMAIMTVLVDCAAIALQKQLPDVTEYLDKPTEHDRDDFEEMVDQDIVARVNEVCGGVKFDDPNQVAAAAMAMQAAGSK